MTRARDLADLISSGSIESSEITSIDASKLSGTIADARIPNLAASKITSGTFADARIASSNVSQHATSFDDNKIVNDISTLAIRQASNENKVAYNTNSMFVDVFQDSTGIGSFTTSGRNDAEYVGSNVITEAYETGNRTSTYTLTANSMSAIFADSDGFNNWLDGTLSSNEASSWVFQAANNNLNGSSFVFDLGSGNSKVYVGARMQTGSTNGSHGTWKWEGSNNNSSYTALSSNFTWGNSTDIQTNWSNDIAYRYIRLIGQVGAVSNHQAYQNEITFKVKTTSLNATGNFISNAITAPSSTNKMGAIITYEDAQGTNTLNTDIVLQLSADNGSNFTTATMTALPDFATGIKMAKVNDLSVTAGTQLKYKISFANQSGSKEARIRGVSLQY
jgi:hypothetical protein